MEHILKAPELIQKEIIPTLRFGREDVLQTVEGRKRRQHDIHRATLLGNAYHGKVDIFFITEDGEQKRVNTTIWDYDKEYIMLKSGSSLPIRCINGVEFY
ncbi:hypothetical protein [Adhaeribacter soli]|jgi:hypothetical protein|uniref:Uncharacterized protein n=1 Tax=Adhaeribacter soli TaxID=2607655 RepID=A0A5N1J246_9BACT|nr:hypothetical protein [Adhaeribacter soli]KAA9340592.1 hypothetical protein F0P94_03955 [Adhaeribacter soli]